MQIGAENRPEMMQIVVEIAKMMQISHYFGLGTNVCKSDGSHQLRQPTKLSRDALLHHLTMSEFLAR